MPQQETYQQKIEAAKTATDKEQAQKDLRKLERELNEKSKIPSNNEIQEVEKGGTCETKYKLAISIIERTFLEDDNPDHNLAKAHEMGKNNKIDWKAGRDEHEPQVHYKQITKTVEERSGFLGLKRTQKEVMTDEVLVVITLNNGEKPGDNTVVCGVMRQKDGKLVMGEGSQALLRVTTEADYKKSLKEEEPGKGADKTTHPSLTAQFNQGELTMEEYQDKYKKANGKSLADNWKQYDENVKQKSDYWRSEERRADVMDRLETKYIRYLEQAKDTRKEIHQQVEEEKKKNEAKRNKIFGDVRFKAMAAQVKAQRAANQVNEANLSKSILASLFQDLSDQELEELISR